MFQLKPNQPAALHDGIRYGIEGGPAPGASGAEVVPAADPPGLPVPPPGYEHRSFRLSAPVAAAERGFLRVRVAWAAQ